MKKRDIKKVVLGQLSNMLRNEVIIDGPMGDDDLERPFDAQKELADEFERRAAGTQYSSDWDY